MFSIVTKFQSFSRPELLEFDPQKYFFVNFFHSNDDTVKLKGKVCYVCIYVPCYSNDDDTNDDTVKLKGA